MGVGLRCDWKPTSRMNSTCGWWESPQQLVREFQGRREESENLPLIFLSFHRPPFARPTLRTKHACSLLVGG